MIDVSFVGDTMGEVRTQMLEFLGLSTEAAPKVTKKTEPIEKATLAAAVDTSKTLPTAATSAPATASVPPTYKDVADLIPKLVGKHGKPKVVALLEAFGAKNGKELKVEQYAEFIAKATAELPL